MWLLHRRQSLISFPYTATPTPSHQRHRKCQNTRVANNHHPVPGPLQPPSNSAPPGTNKYHPNATSTAGFRRKNAKTPPASPECASVLPGDVGDDRVHICTRFRWCPPPGSPMGLPASFKLLPGVQVVDTPVLHAFFLRAQHRQLYYMYCNNIIYITSKLLLYGRCATDVPLARQITCGLTCKIGEV